MFSSLFKKKIKGCLDGKTPEQKESFFRSLYDMYSKDNDFFNEQFLDLTSDERRQFIEYIDEKNKNLHILKALVGVLSKISPKK